MAEGLKLSVVMPAQPRSASATRGSASTARITNGGFGMAIRAGLDVYTGDAVAIVMADASDDPEDLVRHLRLLEEGYDCASAPAS